MYILALAHFLSDTHALQVVDVDGDIKAIDTAMKVLNTRAPELPVCLLSKSGRGDKVACLAAVPPALTSSMDAKDWVNAALDQCGGKGGGKADRAQGAAKDASAFPAALQAATDFAAAKRP